MAADVTLSVQSERLGQTTLYGTSGTQTSSADWTQNFLLPAGFGDCAIVKAALNHYAIQTPVANPETRGPSAWIVSSGVVRDFMAPGNGRWRKYATGQLEVDYECLRPTTWYQGEKFGFTAAFEDTGAGNLSVVALAIVVLRLRNQVDEQARAVFDPAVNISPTR